MKTLKCPHCDSRFTDPDRFVSHLEAKHLNDIPEQMLPDQYYYFLKTGKRNGNCVICKKPTKWNPKTHKYNRFCENPNCKEKYIKEFRTRMIGKYGKVHLLNDPEQQRKMLENRSISGKYKWSTGEGYKIYTGQNELSLLEFLDQIMDYDFNDIITPSPHTYMYIYEGTQHFYFPDLFIGSLNLEIEVKDGGNNPNMHPKIQAVDKVKEALKDEVMRTNGNFNYLKIVNKENKKFFEYLERAKKNFLEDKKEIIFMP